MRSWLEGSLVLTGHTGSDIQYRQFADFAHGPHIPVSGPVCSVTITSPFAGGTLDSHGRGIFRLSLSSKILDGTMISLGDDPA